MPVVGGHGQVLCGLSFICLPAPELLQWAGHYPGYFGRRGSKWPPCVPWGLSGQLVTQDHLFVYSRSPECDPFQQTNLLNSNDAALNGFGMSMA